MVFSNQTMALVHHYYNARHYGGISKYLGKSSYINIFYGLLFLLELINVFPYVTSEITWNYLFVASLCNHC